MTRRPFRTAFLASILLAVVCNTAAWAQVQPPAVPQPSLPVAPYELVLSADLIAAILGSIEDFWRAQMAPNAGNAVIAAYVEPKLRIFVDDQETLCGNSRRFRGLFYCGAENRIYFREGTVVRLTSPDDNSGDFAVAFIVAHEVGHAIQFAVYGGGPLELSRTSSARIGELSRAFELQADCLAGAWARYVQDLGLLDPGDVEEAIALADRVGDTADGGASHGTAEERADQFRAGMRDGRPASCDTFPLLVEAASGNSLTRAFGSAP